MFNFQNLDKKKTGLIVGFFLFIIIIGYLMYIMFFRPIIIYQEQQEAAKKAGQLPTKLEGQPTGIITDPDTGELTGGEIVTRIPAEQGRKIDNIARGGITKVDTIDYNKTSFIKMDDKGQKLISYHPDLGKFYKIGADGEKIELTSKVYKDVQDIAWNPSKDAAILEFPDGSNIYYDFEQDKQISLPKDWTEFSFNQQGSNISFKDMNNIEDYRFYAIAKPDGSSVKYLEPLGYKDKDFVADWSPSGKITGYMKAGADGESQKLYFIGQYEESFNTLRVMGFGLETKWTPDGQKMVYSAHNQYTDHKPLLHIVDANGDNIGANHQTLDVNTWADKCTFQDNSTLYCAVPKEMPWGADYQPAIMVERQISDYIYKIDLATGVKTFIAEPENDFIVEDMQVSEDGSKLYFTDANSKALHSINLK